MEDKRAKEIERGRTEVMQEFEGKEREQREIMGELKEELKEEAFYEPNTLPVCIRTPRMLVTGKAICQELIISADNSKCLHQ